MDLFTGNQRDLEKRITKGERKNDNEYLEELEEKWKFNYLEKNQYLILKIMH